ncbi:LOW QUALITY PROTEIN: hypothetical protein Cgig2_016532 [Carnegiea gigantea]|uniref:CCHC-type domain-containing protein n=1 Tax=Carnegiea gigantea TaxID=171969 RepID=A0A9Q1Q971_9CARY|nr:LOW QUALITY PROTEIN: hypothetical protein Cgig2_016532 [Carnegiea gigantea]
MEDYEHMITMAIGDNYVAIQEWVPNFIPKEDKITKLATWVRIPKLSVEYFNKNFLLNKIGSKIGRVLRVEHTTETVEKGQYTRLSVEVDLTKPLLSKFQLNVRIWQIQYEGLCMVCFHCGKQGHKEDSCPMKPTENPVATEQAPNVNQEHQDQPRLEENESYGSWMLVRKPARRRTSKQTNQVDGQGGDRTGLNPGGMGGNSEPVE